MERFVGEEFAVTVKGHPDRIRVKVETMTDPEDRAVYICAVPGRGEVGESVTLAAIGIMQASLDDAGIRYRPIERRPDVREHPAEFIVEGLAIPDAPDGLVGQLLATASHMGNIAV